MDVRLLFLVIAAAVVVAVHVVPWLWRTLQKPLIPEANEPCYMEDYHAHMFDRPRGQ